MINRIRKFLDRERILRRYKRALEEVCGLNTELLNKLPLPHFCTDKLFGSMVSNYLGKMVVVARNALGIKNEKS